MLEGVIKDFGDMPEMLREGMELKINSALFTIYKLQRKSGKKFVRVGFKSENGCCLEPIYFFEGVEQGYTKKDIQNQLANYSTTVTISKN